MTLRCRLTKRGSGRKPACIARLISSSMDFGGDFGKQYCAPMLLEEMRALPEMFPTLTETGFYVGSFNWFVDWVIMPIAMVAMKLSPHAAIKPMAQVDALGFEDIFQATLWHST